MGFSLSMSSAVLSLLVFTIGVYSWARGLVGIPSFSSSSSSATLFHHLLPELGSLQILSPLDTILSYPTNMSISPLCVGILLYLSSWNRILNLPPQFNEIQLLFVPLYWSIFYKDCQWFCICPKQSFLFSCWISLAYTPLMISHILVVYYLLSTNSSQVNFQPAISCLHLGILQASYSLNCCISKTELIILHTSCVPWLS